MKNFRRGTPAFGLFLGALFLICGALLLWLGFWRTLLLAALFAAGYFVGAVGDKAGFVKETVDRVVPQKKGETIDFRKEVEKEQAAYTREPAENGTAGVPDTETEEETDFDSVEEDKE